MWSARRCPAPARTSHGATPPSSSCNLALASVAAALGIWTLGTLLPHTPAYRTLVSQSTSGAASDLARRQEQSSQIGREGIAASTLRPGGKAQFGDDTLDVITQGELVERGTRVRIIGHSAREAIVEPLAPGRA